MKIMICAFVFSLMTAAAYASPSESFPLNGVYALTDNTCVPSYVVNQQILLISDASGLLIHDLQGCTSNTACDPTQVSQGVWGEYGTGIQSNIGAEGLIVTTGLYARDNKEFVSFENESNDTAGGAPGYGTTIVVVLLDSGILQINYRGQYCTLKSL